MKKIKLKAQVIIKVDGQYYKILITKKEILLAIKKIARKIYIEHHGSPEKLILMPILRGGYKTYEKIASELNELGLEFDTYEVQVGRYSGENGGEPRLIKEPPDVSGREIIFIDDLIDQGDSVIFLNNHLKSKGARSTQCCVLIAKADHRDLGFPIDYIGFTNVVRKWLGGFGMNIGKDEETRSLENIFVKISKTEAFWTLLYLQFRKLF